MLRSARIERVTQGDVVALRAIDTTTGRVVKTVRVSRALKLAGPLRVDDRKLRQARSEFSRWAIREGWFIE